MLMIKKAQLREKEGRDERKEKRMKGKELKESKSKLFFL
jgi:hypothetical protein